VWVIVLVAAAGGAAVALQAQLVGLIDDRLGTLEAVFVTYGVGGLVAAGLMVAARGGQLPEWRAVPGYAYLAGVFGLVIIGSISWSVSRLGVVRGLLLVTVAQFALSMVIDQFGLLGADVRPIDLPKVVGVALLLTGGWLVLR
jgi:transporter family-2 protein